MSPTTGFIFFFVVTLVFLGTAVLAARKHRRRLHIALVGGAVAGLGGTIWYALQMGKHYDLESAGIITPIHLTLAKITTVAFLLPIAAGIRTLYAPGMRPLHKKLAYVVLGLTVLCAITGTIMILLARPLPT